MPVVAAPGLVRFTRPSGGVILARAATAGADPLSFPVEPGTLPTRWDGSPLRISELTPPWKERTAPTGLRFASPEPPEARRPDWPPPSAAGSSTRARCGS
ncbi:MAG TPA: hypothetical protein VGP53_09705, partial [Acidimicrobiales bacterium]|nr:hypothetical protein [Acidimicrobiales bacterium]